jgi:hypothetical protein
MGVAIALQGTAAKILHKTLLAGLGGSGGAGLGKGFGFYGTASAQIAISPSGSAAYVVTYGAPAVTYPWITPSTKGAGVLRGSLFGFSNATDPSQLSGAGLDASGSFLRSRQRRRDRLLCLAGRLLTTSRKSA